MAYARFSNSCHVYVYASIIYGGQLQCAWCMLLGDYVAPTREDMIAHLREHQRAGQLVPEHVFTAIEQELDE